MRAADLDRADLILCHSDRSGGISYYFRFRKLASTEIFRDVSTVLDMTKAI
jgi:hypothetical protein